jgi:hypothetical protein
LAKEPFGLLLGMGGSGKALAGPALAGVDVLTGGTPQVVKLSHGAFTVSQLFAPDFESGFHVSRETTIGP